MFVQFLLVFYLLNDDFFLHLLQDFIINALANYEVIGCVAPYISSAAMASVIKSVLCLIESFVFGTLAFRLYVIDYTHL